MINNILCLDGVEALQSDKPLIVSFSGGRTSAMLALCVSALKNAGLILCPVEFIYMDTGAEHPETYNFIKKVVAFAGIDLTCIKAVISPEAGLGTRFNIVDLSEIGYDLSIWRDLLRKHSTPYVPKGGHCTTRMKQEPANLYLKTKYGKGGFNQILGMRADEPKRLIRSAGRLYMADLLPDVEKSDVLDFWEQMPFDLLINEWEGNCLFCVKKRPNKVALAAIDNPVFADEFWQVLNDPSVRVMPGRPDPLIMYRDFNSLESIRNTFGLFGRGELIARLRIAPRAPRDDGDGCGESCEAYLATDD